VNGIIKFHKKNLCLECPASQKTEELACRKAWENFKRLWRMEEVEMRQRHDSLHYELQLGIRSKQGSVAAYISCCV